MVQESEEQVEIWKDIKGYEGKYQISSYGRVKTLKRRYVPEDKITKLGVDKNSGYQYTALSEGGSVFKTHRIHQLVGNTFLMEDYSKQGLQINHKDGNKSNNKLDNLELVTAKENLHHAFNTGLNKKYNNVILSFEKAEEIREKYAKGGVIMKTLGEEYGVHRGTIGAIINNKIWKKTKS